MHARPVGQGAGDTGGANALGEWLAGHDLVQDRQTRRALREGRLIDPLDWPGGILMQVGPADTGTQHIYVFTWDGDPESTPQRRVGFGSTAEAAPGKGVVQSTSPNISSVLEYSHDQIRAIFAKGYPHAGFYVSSTPTITVSANGVWDASGKILSPLAFPLLNREDVADGETVDVFFIIDHESPAGAAPVP